MEKQEKNNRNIKYKWIVDLCKEEFPTIQVTEELCNHGRNWELGLCLVLSNGEPLRQVYEIEKEYLINTDGIKIDPDAFRLQINGEWEYYVPEDFDKTVKEEFEETSVNKDEVRKWCRSFLFWQKWAEESLIYKRKRLVELGLPTDKVYLSEYK